MREHYSNELYHYGVLGMKWGIRRYQNADGTLTAAGKRRYGTAENLERGMTIKQRAKYDAEKAQALRSGSAADILKFKGDITDAEYKSVEERLRHERALMDSAAQEAYVSYNENKQKVDKFINTATQVKNVVGLATDIYNAGAKIYNSTNPEGKTIAVIGEKNPFKSSKEKELDKIADYGDYDTVMRNKDRLNPEQMKRASERLTNYKRIVDSDRRIREDNLKELDKIKERTAAIDAEAEAKRVKNTNASILRSRAFNSQENVSAPNTVLRQTRKSTDAVNSVKDTKINDIFVSDDFMSDINKSVFASNNPNMRAYVDDLPLPLPEHKSK